jgi:hypothetical protein
MPLTKLTLKPGLYREGTIYSSSGGWYDGDKVRFRSGLPEKIGGWTQVSNSTFNGVARSIWIWTSATTGISNNYIGIGTSTSYYIYFGGTYNDITPIIQTDTSVTLTTNGTFTVTLTDTSYSPNVGDYINFSTSYTVGGYTFFGNYQVLSTPTSTTYTISTLTAPSAASGTVTVNYLYPSGTSIYTTGTGWGAGPWGGTTGFTTNSLTNPFTTTLSSYVVTVTQTAHGLSTGNSVTFLSVASSVGGIPAGVLQQSYPVTVTGTNTYTINVSAAYSGSVAATTGGGAVTVFIPTTSSTSTPAATGWGSASGSGSASSGTQLRLWSNDNFGADLLISPRGGPIFYWQNSQGVSSRAVSLQSLANSTTLLTDSTTFSSGSTSITVTSANAPYVYPYSYISGTGIPAGTYVVSINNVTGVATINNTTTAPSSGSYTYSYSGAFIPNSTYQVLSSDVQEFIIAFGANPYTPGAPTSSFNPLLVRWSDQANAYQWIPEITNQSGEYALGNGSYIVGARSTRQEILVWTDSALYSMQYIGAPYVWGFQLLMDNISIIGPNAMITVNNVTYWMGRDRFYMYNGTVQTLPCTIKQFIFEDINQNQGYQVFAGANEGFNEVWWFYVSIDGNNGSNTSPNTLVDRYAIYNYLDNIWYYGSMARTAWFQTGITQFPVAADYNGRLLYHENGNDDVSTGTPQAIDAYIQSSDIEVSPQDAGQHFGFVWRMFPDVNFNSSTSNNPSVTIQLIPRNSSGSVYGSAANPAVTSLQDYTNIPAYTVQQFTGEVFTRLRGRQMAFRIESTDKGVAWQLGTPRFDIRPDGRR